MANHIPREFIDELINRVDIVDLIHSYYPLKKAGHNFVACCPFHQEKTPSFNVIPTKQFYYCFGCGASGNAISFLLDYERLNFVEAIQLLADKTGMQVPQTASENNTPSDSNKLDALYELLQQVSHYYQQQLRQHPKKQAVIDYLKKRGLSGKIAKFYQLGYAGPGWDNLLKHFSRQQQQLLAAGMLIEKDNSHCYDRFRERVMFPIHDRRGRIIGFGGRVMQDEQPKYLNSPETAIFHKSQELYGLYQVLQTQRKVDQFLIVEGYMDVLALAENNIHFAVATLGTATTLQHIQTLLRYSSSITFCFDGDKAGFAAAWRALQNSLKCLQNGVCLRFMFLPQGEDPDSLVRKEGQQAFLQRIEHAEPLDDYLYRHLLENSDVQTSDGKSRLINDVKPLLNDVPDAAFRHLLLEKLARLVRIETSRLQTMINTSDTLLRPEPMQIKARLSSAQLAIALLAQNPTFITQLNKQLLDIDEFDADSHHLKELLAFLSHNQPLTTAHILEHWRNKADASNIQRLFHWQQQIPESGIIGELTGALQQVKQQGLQNRIQKILVKAQTGGLSETERMELQNMIKSSKQSVED